MPAAKGTRTVGMDIGDSKIAYFQIKEEHAKYFSIAAANVDKTPVLVEKKPYSRKIYDGLSNTVKETATVPLSKWYKVGGSVSKIGAGSAIKIPTELQYTGGTATAPTNLGPRLVTMRVPAIATNYAIANWINTTFTTHKPNYFLTPGGKRHPVDVGVVVNVNPGASEPDEVA